MPSTEAFSRAIIDDQLKDRGWKLTDGHSVRFEHALPGGKRADYLLCDRNGRGLAVIEAKRSSINAADAKDQARHYAEQADVPFIFLANGNEIWFWDWRLEAHPHPVKTFFAQEDLERRVATRTLRVDPMTVPVDKRIAGRDYQMACIDALCTEMNLGRRKLLVEMATGTGKTRTAAALIKRLFEANAVTRVLFLVDRIPLAVQTEEAFAEHLRDYPAYVVKTGRRFDDAKRVTITTLQTMIGVYHEYSSGYFDLIITDECHRSIYGKWKKVLEHFAGTQVGLTATPCVAPPGGAEDEDALFVRDTLRFFEVEHPTFSYTLKQAVDEGYLVGYQIYKAKTVKTAAEGGFEVRREEIEWDGLPDNIVEELNAAFGDRETITVDPNALERKFTIPERNRAIVREFRQVLDQGHTDNTGLKHKPLLGKTIVFAVTKRHAQTLAAMLDQEFAHLKPSPEVAYADYVVSDMGQDDTVDGMTKIRRFKRDKFPEILVSVNMLDTGFDCPEVVNLVFARFTKSTIMYRQMLGRGTRKAQGKPIFTMFDFVGVTDFHGDDSNFAVVPVPRPVQPARPAQPGTLVTVNTDDWIDPTSRSWVSYDPAGNVVFPDADEVKAAELGTRFEEWLGSQEFTVDQERWLHTVESQIRENADLFDEFTADHLDFPPFSLRGGRRYAESLFGGEERVAVLLAEMSDAVYRTH